MMNDKEQRLTNPAAQEHFGLYMSGVLCVVFGAGILFIALYVIPYLWFEWSYPMPTFMMYWRAWLNYKAVYEPFFQMVLIVGPLVMLSVALFSIALLITRRMEVLAAERLHDHAGEAVQSSESFFQEEAQSRNEPVEQSRYFAAKLFFITLSVLALVLFVTEIFLT